MSKHTPGPWVIIPGGDEWSQGRIATIEPKPETMIGTNYWTVAEVNTRRDGSESEFNARLISAAPDLLEALEKLVRNGQKQGWGDNYEADMNTAYAAIDKAKGK